MQNIYATEWPSISSHITNCPFNPNSREYGGEMSDTKLKDMKRIKELEAELAEAKQRLEEIFLQAHGQLYRELKDGRDRYKAALEKIISNELTQPSEIGPLHSAGISLGLQIQADIAQEALKEK